LRRESECGHAPPTPTHKLVEKHINVPDAGWRKTDAFTSLLTVARLQARVRHRHRSAAKEQVTLVRTEA
jgi:hypothetical protein